MINTLVTEHWSDYELIDSGNEEKLERFGQYIFRRPEPKALWKPSQPALWNTAHAAYRRSSDGGGSWNFKTKLPQSWKIAWNELQFVVKPTGFKHTGIFPEQSVLWKMNQDSIKNSGRPISVLNLFAYTGGHTIAAASAGASVTHVDSSKEVITWARENAAASGFSQKPIRWIPEDAITFVKREVQRGTKYDALILDPPKFGRGKRGEVWKIEDLMSLLEMSRNILSEKPLFILLNAYAVSYSSVTLGNMVSQLMSSYKGSTVQGELCIQPTKSSHLLPTSIFARWEQE